eukprot:scaffold500761_cov18-Prasinocladus_malaysianus.AAC.1
MQTPFDVTLVVSNLMYFRWQAPFRHFCGRMCRSSRHLCSDSCCFTAVYSIKRHSKSSPVECFIFLLCTTYPLAPGTTIQQPDEILFHGVGSFSCASGVTASEQLVNNGSQRFSFQMQ